MYRDVYIYIIPATSKHKFPGIYSFKIPEKFSQHKYYEPKQNISYNSSVFSFQNSSWGEKAVVLNGAVNNYSSLDG